MLLLHLFFALTSIIVTTISVIAPSRAKLQAGSVLAAGTLASGTYLVISTHSALLSACISGISYLVVVTSGLLVARRRLVRIRITDN